VERLDDLALLIQKTWRAYAVRDRYGRLKRGQLVIARAWREYLTRKEVNSVLTKRRFRRAVLTIQIAYIRWKVSCCILFFIFI
jgi:hypothetical protein